MNSSLVNEKIREIRKLQQSEEHLFHDDVLLRFSKALKELKGWNTLRINPIDFAAKNNLDPDETIKLFVYGAKTGLFSFEWSLLCPLCGGREHSYHTLNHLEKETYHCTLCDVDVEVEADSHLEVSFTLPRAISGFSPNPYASLNDYQSFFFSPYIVWPPETSAAFEKQPPLRYHALAPGKKVRIKVNLTPTKKYRIVSLDTHSIFTLKMEGRPDSGTPKIALKHTNTGFDKKEETISGASGEMEIINTSAKVIGCIIASPDSGYLYEIIEKYPPYFKPFVTGKMMLNNQPFRDLFLIDNLPDDLSLKINDITLLFTDLKGSTELYDKTGDVYAYKLVQNHFKILHRIVHMYRGGIVKTMGDAIMASFNVPEDGMRAGFAMLEEIEAFNKTIQSAENAIGLKIGLHRGKVIAVKANQTLDYFGQTVNIAARVQGLAGSQEIWITDDMVDDENTRNFIRATGYTLQSKEVALKGVGNPVKAHLCYR